jgi:hypothetical protein
MQTFTCLLSDSRYSVPTLSFFITTDAERARDLARRELQANSHHRAVELYEGERLLWAETRRGTGA